MTREYRGFAKTASANAEIIEVRDGFITGEWIYGYLLKNDVEGKTYIVTVSANGGYCMNEVIAETIGQWTGRTDWKGYKIYDGDYVQVTSEAEKNVGQIGIVTYDNKAAMYLVIFEGCNFYNFSFFKSGELAVVGSRWNKPSEETGGES